MTTLRVNITLPADLVRDIKKSVPKRSRSKFLAEAAREKLRKTRNLKRELIRSLRVNYEYDKKMAKEWDATLMDGLQNEDW